MPSKIEESTLGLLSEEAVLESHLIDAYGLPPLRLRASAANPELALLQINQVLPTKIALAVLRVLELDKSQPAQTKVGDDAADRK